MKNKYSGLSDFEINKLVVEKLGYKYICDDKLGAVLVESISSGYGGFKTIILSKNYCLDYSDAFKLMIDNEIDLLRGRLHSSKGKWVAVKSTKCYTENPTKSINENPCRAIAECFLLMKDAENE